MAASLSQAPFPETVALHTRPLVQSHQLVCPIQRATLAFPQPAEPSDDPLPYVPGEPAVNLTSSEVYDFLRRELDTPLLDELYPWLWLVARRSGKSIDPLHQQACKYRNIVPTEDPNLHLVWHHDKIYIKPIPVCLLSYLFWVGYLPSSPARQSHDSKLPEQKETTASFDRAIPIGFLRSYACLIQHRLDFIIACKNHLLPNDIDWIQWSKFIAHFRDKDDHQVAKRYHFGQLRLSRLNWAVRLFRPRHTTTWWFYEVPFWSTGSYVEWAIAPFVFTFASLSLVLSSMQVIVSMPVNGLGFLSLDEPGTEALRRVCWIFSIIILFVSGTIWILLLVIPSIVLMWQLSWGYKNRGKPVAEEI